MRKAAIFTVLILLLFSPACVKRQGKAPPTTTPPEITPTPEIPAEYQTWYRQMDAYLNRKLVEWKPQKPEPVKFGAYFITLEDTMIKQTDESIDNYLMSVFNELGVSIVEVPFFETVYLNHKSRFDNAIANVRKSDKELYLIGFGAYNVKSFADYKAESVYYAKKLASEYKPEYYVVVSEPTTMAKGKIWRAEASVEAWTELVKEACDAVKEASPSTKCVATTHGLEGEYSRAFSKIDSLDVIGLNPLIATEVEEQILPQIEVAKADGKEVWFEQCWLTLQSHETFFMPWREPLDAKYIEAISLFAQKHGVGGVAPFFSLKYISYFQKTDSPSIMMNAIKTNQRTEVFYVYREIIKEVKGSA